MYIMRLLISSVLLTIMFFISGIKKIQDFNNVSNGLSKKVFFKLIPTVFSKFAIFIVIILEILAPICIISGVYYPELYLLAGISCISLALFTALATFLYHYPPKDTSFHFFMKNVSIIGGLIALSLQFI